MEGKIEILIKESISIAESKFKEDNQVKKFEETERQFKDLVQKGLARERGNNLLSVSDKKSLSVVSFNTR